jgi:2-oxoglutarate ferredoxin oxidoreductase subunit alpha
MNRSETGKSGEVNICVGGAAGQGLQTVGQVLGKVLVRGGCEVFAFQETESRIRGGHNFFQLRASHDPVGAAGPSVDVLVALDRRAVDEHIARVSPDGMILLDSEKAEDGDDPRLLSLPLGRIAKEEGGRTLFGNSVAVGAVLAVMGWEFDPLEKYFTEYYSAKPEIAANNVKASRAGYEFGRKHRETYRGPKIGPRDRGPKLFLSGHEAVGLGALAAEVRFYAGYPMSPSTTILHFMAEWADELGIAVEQAEDEIAALNMAIGASWMGARSMTATSGGGFCLMVEALGLAGITETPVVLVLGQRSGPSTGMATKTAQADLLFAINAGQDEFPRFVFTPGTADEAFRATIKAFDLADKYQTPAMILTDHYMAGAYYTVEKFNLTGHGIDRHLVDPAEAAAEEDYKRYLATESGVSPRLLPGASKHLVGADSHEHNEHAHITEVPRERQAQMEKRLRKQKSMGAEISPPKVFGDRDAETALVCWGSTYGTLAEAIERLKLGGAKVRGVHFPELWPFPAEATIEALRGVKKWATVEGNLTGQLGRLMRMETGLKPDGLISNVTGRPFSVDEIVEAAKKEVL